MDDSVEFEPDGILGAAAGQRFLYVIEGTVTLEAESRTVTLAKDDYAYLPQGLEHRFSASQKARAMAFEKRYVATTVTKEPSMLIGHEPDVAAMPLLGDDDLRVRTLLPDTMAFDFAVNTMAFQPGASLGLVEIHYMEHGLIMLEGGGIYRLDDDWYPVAAGDVIWMAPYCPQWFGAIGKVPAKYLIYKNWNRHLLEDHARG